MLVQGGVHDYSPLLREELPLLFREVLLEPALIAQRVKPRACIRACMALVFACAELRVCTCLLRHVWIGCPLSFRTLLGGIPVVDAKTVIWMAFFLGRHGATLQTWTLHLMFSILLRLIGFIVLLLIFASWSCYFQSFIQCWVAHDLLDCINDVLNLGHLLIGGLDWTALLGGSRWAKPVGLGEPLGVPCCLSGAASCRAAASWRWLEVSGVVAEVWLRYSSRSVRVVAAC